MRDGLERRTFLLGSAALAGTAIGLQVHASDGALAIVCGESGPIWDGFQEEAAPRSMPEPATLM